MGHTAAPEMKTNETSTTTVQIKGEERICELSLDQYTLSEMWELWKANPWQRARPPKEKDHRLKVWGQYPLLPTGQLRPRESKIQIIQLKAREGKHFVLQNTKWKQISFLIHSQEVVGGTSGRERK